MIKWSKVGGEESKAWQTNIGGRQVYLFIDELHDNKWCLDSSGWGIMQEHLKSDSFEDVKAEAKERILVNLKLRIKTIQTNIELINS